MVADCVSCYARHALIIRSYEFLGGGGAGNATRRRDNVAETTVVVAV